MTITLNTLADQFEARARAQGLTNRSSQKFKNMQLDFFCGAVTVIEALNAETDFNIGGVAMLLSVGRDLRDFVKEAPCAAT